MVDRVLIQWKWVLRLGPELMSSVAMCELLPLGLPIRKCIPPRNFLSLGPEDTQISGVCMIIH